MHRCLLRRLSEDLTLTTGKRGSQHEQRPSVLLRAYTLLKILLALLLPRRSLSCVGKFSRGQFSPLHVRLVHSAVHLEPFPLGKSPVASRSREHMSLHLPDLRQAALAQHLRPSWHLPQHKLGRWQDVGYLEGSVSTSIPLPSAYVQGSYLSTSYLVLCY
jgi:hypothetical protein